MTDNPKKTNERQMTGQNQLRKTDRTEKMTCQKTAMILSQGSCPKDENQYALVSLSCENEVRRVEGRVEAAKSQSVRSHAVLAGYLSFGWAKAARDCG